MPLPPLLILVVVSGLAAAIAGRFELRQSPRPIALTRAFSSYLSYALLVVVPISVYFYAFHGDWFLLYLFDVSRIPSAIAMVGFFVQAGLGMLGFMLGAVLVRNQRETLVGIMIGVLVIAAAVVLFLYMDRLSQVGTYAQFHGQFGLEAFEDGSLLTGALAMGALGLAGLGFLLTRLWMSGRAR